MTIMMALAFASPSAKAAQWCSGKILGMYVDASSNVSIWGSYRSEWTTICNVSTAWKGIPTDLCKSWVALVTTLRITQEFATVFYSDDTACSAILSYGTAPAPGYIMINTY